MGLAFLLQGVGNMLGTADMEALRVESAWPTWLSPIGWAQQMRPFGGNHWWPLLLFALLRDYDPQAIAAIWDAAHDALARKWPEHGLELLWPWLGKLGLGRLPGAIVIERENLRLYLPLTPRS